MVLRITQARPEKTDKSRATNRDLLLGGVLVVWMAGLVVQLYHLQIIEYVDLLARAQRQQQHVIEIAPKRGEISTAR
jgi:cell division protein FtsI/penicillin-binding protein 2